MGVDGLARMGPVWGREVLERFFVSEGDAFWRHQLPEAQSSGIVEAE